LRIAVLVHVFPKARVLHMKGLSLQGQMVLSAMFASLAIIKLSAFTIAQSRELQV
jgi:hypothetical protein